MLVNRESPNDRNICNGVMVGERPPFYVGRLNWNQPILTNIQVVDDTYFRLFSESCENFEMGQP